MHNVHVGMHVLGDKGKTRPLVYSRHIYHVAFFRGCFFFFLTKPTAGFAGFCFISVFKTDVTLTPLKAA